MSKTAPNEGTTTYVYDISGNLTAEYGTVPLSVVGTTYLTADHLGSTRMVTSAANTLANGSSPGAAGTPIECRDYLPFGEVLTAGRNNVCASAPDLVTELFTSKERDSETGLDNFLTRYFSSAQGRFTSPDQPVIDQFPLGPQSWNLYSYGRNNPLKYTDPTGQAVQVCTNNEGGGQNCTVISDPQYAAAIAGNNPGVSAPAAGASAGPGGGLAVGGAITCNGAVCGSATYQEESMQDTSGDLVAIASVPSLLRGGAYFGRSLIRGVASLFSREGGAIAKEERGAGDRPLT